jgi:PAS domain S-box-containing protein
MRRPAAASLAASFLETLEEAVVIVDPELRILRWNGAMERLTGVARAAATGRHIAGLVPMLDAIELPAQLGRALGGEVKFTVEVPGRRGQEPSLWLEARCVPFAADDGQPAGAAAFLRDTTERRRRMLFVRAMEAIGRSLTSSLDLDQVLDTIVGKVREVLAADAAMVVSWDGQATGFRVLRATGRLSDRYVSAGWIPVGGGPVSHAVLNARPIATSNILTDARLWLTADRRAEIEREGFKAVAAAPLASKGRAHGALVVHYWTERSFSDEEIMTLSLLGEQAAIAIDNARLYAEATRQANRLRELAEVERLMMASLDLDDVLRGITDAAARLVGAPVAHLWTAEPDGRLRLRAARIAPDVPPVDMPSTIAFGQGITGLAAQLRTPLFVPDAGQDARVLFRAWNEAGLRTIFTLPILAGETLLGVLTLRVRPGGLSLEEDEAFLGSLAARAALAIQNARTYADAVRRGSRLRELAAVSQAITASLDIDEIMERIATAAAAMAPGALASVHVLNAEHRELRVAATSGADWFAWPLVTPSTVGLPGYVVETRAPVLVSDPAAHPRAMRPDWWRDRPGASYYGVPIFSGDALVGVLSYIALEGAPHDEDQEALRLLAAYAGIAIGNASLYRETERRREVAEGLARVAREVTGSLDLERIADLVARGVVELLDTASSTVFRLDPADGTLRAIGAYGEHTPVPKGTVLAADEGVVGRAVLERRVVMTDDVLADGELRMSDRLRERVEASGHRAVVAIPLVAQDRIVGALVMASGRDRVPPADELAVLQAFADQAALGLENARLYASAQDSLARLRDTQAQLVQVAKMSALGQLVSGVAHELNNPLSVIIGYGQLLLHRDAPPAIRRPLELIVAQGDRMAKIVRNLLYFARQRPPERAPVDLHHVIEQTLALRANQLALSSIEVERRFVADLPSVSADAQQLQQVFLNLLLNAEQAIVGEGRPGRIVFRTEVIEGGRMVRAQVIDDGPGIPPESLPRVFEPFFTTKEVGVGTGLGLSVSYGIVEEHGGRLTAESRPGETIFTLELPVGTPAPGETPACAAVEAPFVAEGHRALVVEDEPGVAEFVVGLLRDTGWDVDAVAGGRAGLERVRRHRYDLIVSDMKMPDGSGAEFYHAVVREDPSLARRFLVITGDTANAQSWTFVQDARLPMLEKPFPPDKFLEAVRRLASSLTASGSSA